MKDSPIVVLDEATAFADPENEALIQKALSTLCKNKTVLMIAHRLSSVEKVETTFVIDGGQIAEKGSHHELINMGGLYARMWNDYQKSASWKIEGRE